MIRGTTPTLTFTIPMDFEDIDCGYVTIKQNNNVVLDKQFTECAIDAEHNNVSVHLSQEETLALSAGSMCAIQLRIKSADGEALASNIITVSVADILKDGVI